MRGDKYELLFANKYINMQVYGWDWITQHVIVSSAFRFVFAGLYHIHELIPANIVACVGNLKSRRVFQWGI